VVYLSIGLDFVKNIDKNWQKHLISIDRMKDEKYSHKKNYTNSKDLTKSKTSNIEKNHDFWEFWKKRYLIIR
jgi:hypothetical protein